MPKSITGNTPAPTPRHYDEPQQPTPFDPTSITMMGGLYRLNDIHVLAGNHQKQRPVEFFRSEMGQSVIAELEREFKLSKIPTPYREVVIGKGKLQGTFVCREIVIAYAMWISTAFYLLVIRTFDRVVTGEITYTMRANMADKQIKGLKAHLSDCGSDLCVLGKQVMPSLVKQRQALHNEQQPQLPFTGE